MMGLVLSRRARLGLAAVFAGALLVLLPMRVAFGLMSLDRYGISARAVNGSLWWGRIVQLGVGEMPLGTVDASLSSARLLIGQAHIGISRQAGQADDIRGALRAGVGGIGVDGITGSLPLGAAAAPLPISAVELTQLSARFAGGTCAEAEGQVRARVSGDVAGLNLSQGLAGVARCDGEALLLPLVGQSGMEKLNVRIMADGRYVADLRVATDDADLAGSLERQGFVRAGNDLMIRIEGLL